MTTTNLSPISADPDATHILAFCRSLADSSPVSVPLQPLSDAPPNECFHVVKQHIAVNGGRQVFGWSIWEWPGVYLEAEFHSIWETPDGILIDVTPKQIHSDAITFLHEPKKQYEGRQVNNVRKPLVDSLTVRKFIEANNRIFNALNKGAAKYRNEVAMTPELARAYRERERLHCQLVATFGAR